ncbi:MAG TPA: DUF1003 domain-containing protein [Pyrinomonadaceae bacterium]|nr:DUF1003 domain-containing protein [Pyrinomonadaceae bacterium]
MGKSNNGGSVATADPMAYNVEAIAQLELKELHRRSAGEKVSDVFVSLMGSMPFLLFHILWFVAWFTINLHFIPGIASFDPFPFGILTLIVSSEGVFLAIFILISQNRMTRQSDKRAHLDLQVSMLAEQEMTMMLRMQRKVCEHLGVEVDDVREEAEQLIGATDVQRLVSTLEKKMPG